MPDLIPEEVVAELIERASIHFDEMVQERHNMGAQKYGETKYLETDSIEMALEELADLANYVRYTFVKLYLLRVNIAAMTASEAPPDKIGIDSVSNPYGR